MEFEFIKFGKVIYQDNDFTLSYVVTPDNEDSYVALIPTCLQLKKAIPSIPQVIRSSFQEISNIKSQGGYLSTIIDSGVNHELNPFLITTVPKGKRLIEYKFNSIHELSVIYSQLASCLASLHEYNIYQRDISIEWDLYFDGQTLSFSFPAARDVFHKAYVDTSDGATVHGIPRFIVLGGSIYEDVLNYLNTSKKIADLLPSVLYEVEKENVKNYLDLQLDKLKNDKRSAGLILETLSKANIDTILASGQKVSNLFPGIAEIENKPVITRPRFDNNLDSIITAKPKKFKKLLLIFSISLLFVFFTLIFFKKADDLPPVSDVKIEEPELPPQFKEALNLNHESGQVKVEDQVKSKPENKEVEEPEEVKIENAPEEAANKQMQEVDEVPLLDPNWKDNEITEVVEPSKENAPVEVKNSQIESAKVNSEVEDFSVLRKNAESANFEVRIEAAKKLSEACIASQSNALSLLKTLLEDSDVLVRGFAVRSYAACLGPKESNKYLRELFNKEESEVVRGVIKKVLEKK